MELRDINAQNTANLGATVNFIIPKIGDLLGPLDLVCEFNKVSAAAGSIQPTSRGWGYAPEN